MRLDAADVEAIAMRVVEVLREQGLARPATSEMIDAAEVARRFGVTVVWARRNAGRLGAVRLGDGPRGRLRFDPARVAAALTALPGGVGSEAAGSGSKPGPAPGSRGRAESDAAGNLPVRSLDLGSLPDKTARRRSNAPGPAPGGKS